jgi:hypothetical protein
MIFSSFLPIGDFQQGLHTPNKFTAAIASHLY